MSPAVQKTWDSFTPAQQLALDIKDARAELAEARHKLRRAIGWRIDMTLADSKAFGNQMSQYRQPETVEYIEEDPRDYLCSLIWAVRKTAVFPMYIEHGLKSLRVSYTDQYGECQIVLVDAEAARTWLPSGVLELEVTKYQSRL